MAKKKPTKSKVKTLQELKQFEKENGRGNVDKVAARQLRREIKKGKK